jgi:hypothetical protein
VLTAVRLHDIGWRHWEAAAQLNPDTGRPANFLDVMIDEHLRLYGLGIEEVAAIDDYAGMLVSMHAAGIYTGRYGTQPAMLLTRAPAVQSVVDDFISEQEARYSAVKDGLGVSDEDLWRNFLLLQVFDRLSLRLATLGQIEARLAPVEDLVRVVYLAVTHDMHGGPVAHGCLASAAACAAAGSASAMRSKASSSRAAETNQVSKALGGA